MKAVKEALEMAKMVGNALYDWTTLRPEDFARNYLEFIGQDKKGSFANLGAKLASLVSAAEAELATSIDLSDVKRQVEMLVDWLGEMGRTQWEEKWGRSSSEWNIRNCPLATELRSMLDKVQPTPSSPQAFGRIVDDVYREEIGPGSENGPGDDQKPTPVTPPVGVAEVQYKLRCLRNDYLVVCETGRFMDLTTCFAEIEDAMKALAPVQPSTGVGELIVEWDTMFGADSIYKTIDYTQRIAFRDKLSRLAVNELPEGGEWKDGVTSMGRANIAMDFYTVPRRVYVCPAPKPTRSAAEIEKEYGNLSLRFRSGKAPNAVNKLQELEAEHAEAMKREAKP